MKPIILSSCRICWAVLLLASVVPPCALAQTTVADIKARLINQPLYLRGQWNEDKLSFDETGHLLGTAGVASFTLSGIEVDSVKLSSKELVLEGERVGLEFTKDLPQRVLLLVGVRPGQTSPEKVSIRIKAPADGDFTKALSAIFAENVAGLSLQMPECWQQFARKHLLPPIQSAEVATATSVPGDRLVPLAPENVAVPEGPPLRKIGGGVTPPHVLKQSEPEFSASARALKYQGLVLVSLIVGTDGIPKHVQVLHPAGLGLDERAVAAVSQYSFSPAVEGGNPVAVMLNVEVNFQIF